MLTVSTNKSASDQIIMSRSRGPGCAQIGQKTTDSEQLSPIENVPLEVLDHIFSFSVIDCMDIGLFLTSNRMAQKLVQHPAIRAVKTFSAPKELLVLFPEETVVRKGASKSAWAFLVDGNGSSGEFRGHRLLSTAWCNNSFVEDIQLAVIKRALSTHWDPLLVRDGYTASEVSHAYLWHEVDQTFSGETVLPADIELASQAGPIIGRWPWTHVVIWPKHGRILIRDQLCNLQLEICCPVLEVFLALKKTWIAL